MLTLTLPLPLIPRLGLGCSCSPSHGHSHSLFRCSSTGADPGLEPSSRHRWRFEARTFTAIGAREQKQRPGSMLCPKRDMLPNQRLAHIDPAPGDLVMRKAWRKPHSRGSPPVDCHPGCWYTQPTTIRLTEEGALRQRVNPEPLMVASSCKRPPAPLELQKTPAAAVQTQVPHTRRFREEWDEVSRSLACLRCECPRCFHAQRKQLLDRWRPMKQP